MSANATSNEHDEIFSTAHIMFSFVHSMSLSGFSTSTSRVDMAYFKIKVYQVRKKCAGPDPELFIYIMQLINSLFMI
jgi:hypothetical protein